MMLSSRSLEALLDKTKATLTGKSQNSQNIQSSREPPGVQRVFLAKGLPKSLCQGSANSSEKRALKGASFLLPGSSSPRLDSSIWRCHGPLSHCFLRGKTNTDGDDEDKEMPSRALSSVNSASLRHEETDHESEQGNALAAMTDTSLKGRLAHVDSMKGKTYSLHTGFAVARKDALEMAAVLRFSVGCHLCRGGETRERVNEADMDTYSQLLSVQAKVLDSTCSRMAEEYSAPEELLLTLTHSFHTLCCLTQACMSLVEGLRAEGERRALVAKVDEVIMNYVCLLKAAEVASGSSSSDQSVNALTHHSATMSAIINALVHSLKTLLSK